jgi:uncharacterized protein (TIGR03382 family)
MKRAFVFAGALLLGTTGARAAAAEFCGDAASDSGFAVERVWPRDCDTGTPLDALVYVDGEALAFSATSAPEPGTLAIRVLRSDDAVELPGSIEFVQGGRVALWRGLEPFAPHTAYNVTAQRLDANGEPSGAARGGNFVTGDSFMAPITPAGELAVSSRQLTVPQRSCHYDACGESECVEGEGTVERIRVSIEMPSLDGGLPAAQGHVFDTRYDVVAVFAEDRGHIFASSKWTFDRQTPGLIELDIPVLPDAFEGCAQVTVSDLSGATLELPAKCITIAPEAENPKYAQHYDGVGAGDERLDPAQVAEAGAAGCNATGSARVNLPLMLAALLLLVARRRLPF